MQNNKVIGIASNRRGAGVSSLAVLTSNLLSANGYKTLLIENSGKPDLQNYLYTEVSYGIDYLLDFLEADILEKAAIDSIKTRIDNNLDCLFNLGAEYTDDQMERLLFYISGYDYIVLDLPSKYNFDSQNYIHHKIKILTNSFHENRPVSDISTDGETISRYENYEDILVLMEPNRGIDEFFDEKKYFGKGTPIPEIIDFPYDSTLKKYINGANVKLNKFSPEFVQEFAKFINAKEMIKELPQTKRRASSSRKKDNEKGRRGGFFSKGKKQVQ